MAARTRIPNDLLWPLLWCAFMGVLCVVFSGAFSSLAVRIVYGALGALYLLVAVSLARLRNWARVAAGVLFAVGLGLTILQIARRGLDVGRGFRLAMNAWWGIYMFLPSTRRLFAVAERPRIDAAGCLTQAVLLAVPVGAAAILLPLGITKWVSLGVPALLLAFMLAVESRLERAFGWRLARRPEELDPSAWKAFREALHLRARGDHRAAARVLEALPDVPCVRALRALALLDRAPDPLARVVFDSEFVPSEDEREEIARRIRDPETDLDGLLEARAAAVDALLEDEARPRPLLSGELDRALTRITGLTFVRNPEFQHAQAWREARPRSTGPRARTWLAVRLWERMAHEAAEEAARGTPDRKLLELARLSRATAEGSQGLSSAEWVERQADSLVLIPSLADAMRLLHLDLPYVGTLGGPAVASRLRLRLELVAMLRQLRDEYPADAGDWVALLLSFLANHPKGLVRKRAAFDAWWQARRHGQIRFDTSFTQGLEAAVRDDWAAAERAFGEAAAAWPERTCAAYNRAVALLRMNRHADAEAVFRRLAEAEAEEPLYWMRLGDARRLGGRTREALGAYRRAARLGGLEEEVALRLGIALAEEGREKEALAAIESATGPEPPAGKLEELADFLESQGVFRLAHHYRQKALERRLGEAAAEEDDDNEESAPPA